MIKAIVWQHDTRSNLLPSALSALDKLVDNRANL